MVSVILKFSSRLFIQNSVERVLLKILLFSRYTCSLERVGLLNNWNLGLKSMPLFVHPNLIINNAQWIYAHTKLTGFSLSPNCSAYHALLIEMHKVFIGVIWNPITACWLIGTKSQFQQREEGLLWNNTLKCHRAASLTLILHDE